MNNTLDRFKSLWALSQTCMVKSSLTVSAKMPIHLLIAWWWELWFHFFTQLVRENCHCLFPSCPDWVLWAYCQFIAAVANCHFIERTMYETSTSPKCCCDYTSLAQFLFFYCFLFYFYFFGFCLNIQISVENLTNPRK